jgi:hypothetical protein
MPLYRQTQSVRLASMYTCRATQPIRFPVPSPGPAGPKDSRLSARKIFGPHQVAKAKDDTHPEMSSYGETRSRTGNLLHLTCGLKHGAKKMSYR